MRFAADIYHFPDLLTLSIIPQFTAYVGLCSGLTFLPRLVNTGNLISDKNSGTKS